MNFRIQRGKDNFLSTRKRQFLVNAEYEKYIFLFNKHLKN